jgi:uncharacterized protein (DUF433 family)
MSPMAQAFERLAAASSGCYDARRSTALSGVPLRTVYDWAHKGIVVPSVSPVQEKLWSYQDLLVLRAIAWLRKAKVSDGVRTIPASPMAQVREALRMTVDRGLDPWSDPVRLLVDLAGQIFVSEPDGKVFSVAGRQHVLDGRSVDLLDAFDRGPNLVRPRERLRITPGRLSGEPYVQGTRLSTLSIKALADDGYGRSRIARMYGVEEVEVNEAIAFEEDMAA